MYYDPYGLWAWGDPIDQDIVDGVSGFGDTMSFNATNWIRDQAGWNGSVDKCSSAYAVGQWTGVGYGLAMGGVGLGQAGFRAEMGAWKQGGQWFAGGRKMPHFHFGNGPGMGKHHLPYQVSSRYKNFAANVRRGVGANDLKNFGGATYGFGAAFFGAESNQ
ncbi:hypothetical protein BJL95_07165 [Methylomonas sp. LWB]|nr:hypothetical protein BJL95_07165 [Methylomonas sp. LWB]